MQNHSLDYKNAMPENAAQSSATDMRIEFYDDKKEKHMSHEAQFVAGSIPVADFLSDIGYLDYVGFGRNQKDAQQDLINTMKKNVEKLENITAIIKELIKKYDNDSSTLGSTFNG